jgi:MFS transporter, FHS family, L-fucose permease
MKNESSLTKALPVLFGFFVMGFVDVVGIATNYVKKDFLLNDTLANLLPMMVFLWFLILSVPTGLLMNKIGRRKTVILSGCITFIAMLVPFLSYQFPFILLAFALLGIGNTLLQVSLNPLLTNVIRGDRLTSSLTLGQFIKAIASFLGPFIAAWATVKLGNWKYIFPIFAFVTLLSTIWLLVIHIKEEPFEGKHTSYIDCFGLLRDKTILALFLGIFFVVGIDVGLNTTIPKLLQERCNLPLSDAGFGTSLYFVARTLGAFLGAFILAKVSSRRFFILNMVVATVAMVFLFVFSDLFTIRILIFIMGFTVANVFPVIFSAALKHKPNQFNEISGLMIMGVSGGAFITFIIGVASDMMKSQSGGLIILFVSFIYLLVCALRMKK